MFDEIKKVPEDIFAESDKTAPQVAPPTALPPIPSHPSGPSVPGERMAGSRRSFPWKAIVLVVGILVVVGAAFYISMKILGSSTPVTPEPPSDETTTEDAQTETASAPEEETAPVVAEETKPSTADRDKDGLTDVEEKELGTSSRAADTDGDGLFDLEEVRTWETDPLNPDTDGDGYLDGEEVSGGYNPSGEGTLRDAPTESD